MLKFKDCGFKEKHSFEEYESVILNIGDDFCFFTLNIDKDMVIQINGDGRFGCIPTVDGSYTYTNWEDFFKAWSGNDEFDNSDVIQYFDSNFLFDFTITNKKEK